ncbi:F420-dependent glucose-6-phosphate dehydrogenase 1 [Dyadobacter sp. CECT 9623]|uniref:F420-dependent glucose-6-phosphate dehydrogenase 1 n=1 Tax=Dyadobacter linearis TaxID=2823330 RepID=A0ABM8UJY2_9BACT|nr:TIGR03885 family FMN-dependent LLM class oxidoreductase [Dyadobacter sp. CECT 9623]CAG5067756.1 F420-dependent glucose-6-phosphate dehydrogenase 1 [Dyadobacter sp. CECT 9623]
MTKIGYHASHEQFSPSELLRFAKMAEESGFRAAMSSDHLNPWSREQGHSGHCWSWLGAALQATHSIPFGSLSIPGGWRFHPVVVAHAAATLAQMSPNRFQWIALGSGEALNEMVVSPVWPDKKERNERIKEAADIIRALWRGETVTSKEGYHYTDEAKIWSLPETPPQIFGAALTTQTAHWMGSWADGLVTVNKSIDVLKQVMQAFNEGGGANKPKYVQVHISWADTMDIARQNAFEQWRVNTLAPEKCANFRKVADFENATNDMKPSDMDEHLLISEKAEVYIDYLQRLSDLGFDGIFVHNVGRNQAEYIEFFGKNVLPRLAGTAIGR